MSTGVKFKKRKSTEFIAIHSAATKASMDIGAREIGSWHRERGWLGIGYHFVIKRDGTVEEGRPHDTVGAHVSGHNHNSLGICMAGGIDDKGKPENNFTDAQFHALKVLLAGLTNLYPEAKVQGHGEFSGTATACPSFKASEWYAREGKNI